MCDSGCSAYEDRPKICSDFRCLWLEDTTIPDWIRPATSGLLMRLHPQKRTLFLYSVYGKLLEPSTLLYVFYYAYVNNLIVKCYFDNTEGHQDLHLDRLTAMFKFSNYEIL